MEAAIAAVDRADYKTKLGAITQLQQLLQSHIPNESEWGSLVTVLSDAMKTTNYKLCQAALQCMTVFVNQVGAGCRPYLDSLMPTIIKRMGDTKQVVREEAVELLLAFMGVLDIGMVMERAAKAGADKNANAREQFLVCFVSTLDMFGPVAWNPMVYVSTMAKLLQDSNGPVRNAAVEALARLIQHLPASQAKIEAESSIRPAQLEQILAKLNAAPAIKSRPSTGSLTDPASVAASAPVAAPAAAPKRVAPSASARTIGSASAAADRPPTGAKLSVTRSKSQAAAVSAATAPVDAPRKRAAAMPMASTAPMVRGESESTVATDDDVEPITLYTDRELINEMEDIGGRLVNTTRDWHDRLLALRRLRGLVMGGAAEHPQFCALLAKHKSSLNEQLKDLRSAIVKEACLAVSDIVFAAREDAETVVDFVLPTLLRSTFVTTQVVALSADGCLRSILQSTTRGFVRVLKEILDTLMTHRSPVLRGQCVQYVMLALQMWDAALLDRCPIEPALLKAFTDADSDVRMFARRAFWAYASKFPDAADRMMSMLDSTTQKYLHDERDGMEEENARFSAQADETEWTSPPRMDNSDAAYDDADDDDYFPAPDDASNGPASPPVDTREYRPLALGQPSTARRTSMGPAWHSSGAPAAAPAPAPAAPVQLGAASRRISMAPPPPSGPDPVTAAPALGHAHRAPALAAAPAAASLRQSAAPRLGSAVRATVEVNVASVPPPQPSARSHVGGAMRVPVEFAASEPYEEPVPVVPESRPGTGSRAAPAAPPVLPPFQTQHSTASEDDNPLASMMDGLSLAELLQEAGSDDWGHRMAALDRLSVLIADDTRRSELKTAIERVARIILTHAADPHQKVARSALMTTAVLVERFGKPLEAHLDWMLPRVLRQLASKRDTTHAAASNVLQKMQQHILGSALVPAVVKSLDEAEIGVKTGALESLQHLLAQPDVMHYFQQTPRMRQVVHKLASSANAKQPDVRKIAASCLVHLHAVQPALFVGVVASLLPVHQTAIIKATVDRLPSLSAEVATQSRAVSAAPTPSSASVSPPVLPGPIPVVDDSADGYVAAAAPAAPPSMPTVASRTFITAPSVEAVLGLGTAASVTASRLKTGSEYDSTAYSSGMPPAAVTRTFSQESNSAPVAGGDRRVLLERPQHNVREPDVDAQHLPLLLSTLNDGVDVATQRAILHKMGVMLGKATTPIRAPLFGQTLSSVLECLRSSETSVLLAALPVIRRMVRMQPQSFEDYTEMMIARLLSCARHPDKEVLHATEKSLDLIVSTFSVQRCLQVLTPILYGEDGQVLQSCILMLSRLVGRMTGPELSSYCDRLLPGLFKGFQNPSADIRKAVVFCLVDMYMVMGDTLVPRLQPLSAPQLKLVTIYITRALESRKAKEQSAQAYTSEATA